MHIAIQAACQLEKTAEKGSSNVTRTGELGGFTTTLWGFFPMSRPRQSGTPALLAAWSRKPCQKGIAMLGKIAGALLGKRIAGRHSGAKGAILGYGAAALARRSVPALAAVTLAGWLFNKVRERRRAPAYPSEASPSPPSA
jgi:hypothetical protein